MIAPLAVQDSVTQPVPFACGFKLGYAAVFSNEARYAADVHASPCRTWTLIGSGQQFPTDNWLLAGALHSLCKWQVSQSIELVQTPKKEACSEQ